MKTMTGDIQRHLWGLLPPVDARQHPLLLSAGLHLLPGALATAVYVLLAPSIIRLGFPGLLAAYLVLPAVIIPSELGYLLYQGLHTDGRLSLHGVVLFRAHLRPWYSVVAVPLLLAWGAISSGLVAPIDQALLTTLFARLPEWYRFTDLSHYATLYASSTLVATLLVGLVLNGIVAPVVEELYFRGYLLPRLARFGRWAPLINVCLFSLYHFWTPWQLVSRIAALLPVVYGVWWKRNLYLGILTHCLLNTLGMLLMFGLMLR